MIKELVKKDQENTVDSFVDRAKAMTEADVQTKLDSINSKIGSAISDFKDSMRAKHSFTTKQVSLSRFYQQSKESYALI